MFQILVKIAMFTRPVLSQEASNLYNIWPRGSSIPIFSRSGSSKISTSLMGRSKCENFGQNTRIFCHKKERKWVFEPKLNSIDFKMIPSVFWNVSGHFGPKILDGMLVPLIQSSVKCFQLYFLLVRKEDFKEE